MAHLEIAAVALPINWHGVRPATLGPRRLEVDMRAPLRERLRLYVCQVFGSSFTSPSTHGIGSSIAANKVPGARAAPCYDRATARNSREHNDANLLSLGARMIPAEVAREVVAVWLETPFAGGRHQRRVDKIRAIEERHRKA